MRSVHSCTSPNATSLCGTRASHSSPLIARSVVSTRYWLRAGTLASSVSARYAERSGSHAAPLSNGDAAVCAPATTLMLATTSPSKRMGETAPLWTHWTAKSARAEPGSSYFVAAGAGIVERQIPSRATRCAVQAGPNVRGFGCPSGSTIDTRRRYHSLATNSNWSFNTPFPRAAPLCFLLLYCRSFPVTTKIFSFFCHSSIALGNFCLSGASSTISSPKAPP
mmetsp:Transcript_9531/g.21892  ORF Transcript_9531/g.21892 Transcript_9531/m.21892 type:complete len:223 (-) Transcript_9531:486-1154(-)